MARNKKTLRVATGSGITVALIGMAVVSPYTLQPAPSLDKEPVMQERLYQEFTPNINEEADFVLPSVPAIRIPDPPKEKKNTNPTTRTAPPKYTGGGSPASWMAAAGIPAQDWGYVDYIVNRESHWNPNATNRSSGACGLVQALPCGKVPGNGYDPVDNLRWANGYATGRYGSWADAHAFWTSNHWW